MILNILNNSDTVVFIIVLFLICISMMMVYLVYSQNKQLTKELMMSNKNRQNQEKQSVDNIENLKEISKELAKIPKEKNIPLTSYEQEQEKKAIISYDELLNASQNVSIQYSDTEKNDDITIRKVDLENTGKIELDPIKKEQNSKVSISTYEHEEEFLNALKQLQSLLN